MRSSATVSSKGQLVIPAELRRKYGLKPGARVIISERDGALVLEPARGAAILSMYGAFKHLPLLEDQRKDKLFEKAREERLAREYRAMSKRRGRQ